jgi:hypothetical protein
MNKKFHFLNHTSFLIEYDSYYLLLDPWPTESLSFDSWKTHPPCFIDSNILASFVNSSDDKSGIIISHGHDDHCDDSFLKKIKPTTPTFFPDYRSKGSLNRLKANNLNNILLLNSLKKRKFGPFEIYSFIISQHSEDDAVIIIDTDDYLLVHANDNSVKFPNELIKLILKLNNQGIKKTFFASQTGIANGFPYCYPQFGADQDLDKIKKISQEKICNTIQIAVDNANLVKTKHFLSYAAYTISLTLLEKFGKEILPILFFPSPANLKKLPLDWGKINLLDYVPGDTLDLTNDNIFKPFWNNNGFENMISELEKLRLNSIKNFKKEKDDQLKKFEIYDDKDLINYIKQYLKEFHNFLVKSKNILEIQDYILEIKIENLNSVFLDFKDGAVSTNKRLSPNKKITISKNISWLLISGIYNFESLYIGHHAKFERFPPEKFNKTLIMQLQIFGYIYQKRLVPRELDF